ncbi:hypothetical protein K402DRAFT_466688 [Aulographum hederae CBS 113979]|uniref:Helix-turn-helix domain-containing protein n=1 Tax=Aulographum hederae CBS 113979 TaxID=1176131 RepID=A0A6G1GNQ6_9PEZI|nr:hypothetical protein K402DRAFT_466688 [Aulographum hederae CBS 113979]
MGSSGSKTAKSASSTLRKYPSRPSPLTNAPSSAPPPGRPKQPGPTVRPQPQASSTRTEAINLDASDPHFARRLGSIGPVDPNPYLSNSSTSPFDPTTASSPYSHFPPPASRAGRTNFPDPSHNPAIMILRARQRIQDEADAEEDMVGRTGFRGKRYLEASLIRQMLVLRDGKGMGAEAIERELMLAPGTVGRLGPRDVVANAG